MTARGCRIEDMDPLRREKGKLEKKEKGGAALQISSAAGEDLMEMEEVN